MALLSRRRSIFLAGFLGSLVVLASLLPQGIVAGVALLVLAAYLAEWGTALAATTLPKSYVGELNDRAVLVTGCDSGFGQQLAKRLDAMGVRVFAGVLSKDSDGAKHLALSSSKRLSLLQMDVTSDEEVQQAVREVSESIGDKKLQAIVNNAGVSAVTEVEWCPVDTYRKVLEVNALGPIRVTQAFLPLLRRGSGGGRVVIVASLAGRYTFPGFTAYSMSKSAAVSFADGLRREMRKWSISVHTVEPTLYKTPISAAELIGGTMQRHWEQSPDTIRSIYGEEYFQEFKNKILLHVKQRAKPQSKISEVVDDMVDAALGIEPRLRYIPSVAAQFRAQVLTAMPTPLQDFVLCRAQPSTPPAAVSERKKEDLRRLIEGNKKLSGGRGGGGTRTLQRLKSVPTWFLRNNNIESRSTNIFQFPEVNSKEE